MGGASLSCSPSLLSFHSDVTGICEHQGAGKRGHSLGRDGTAERYFCHVCVCTHARTHTCKYIFYHCRLLTIIHWVLGYTSLSSFHAMCMILTNYKIIVKDKRLIIKSLNTLIFFFSISICFFLRFFSLYHAFHPLPLSSSSITVRLLCAIR